MPSPGSLHGYPRARGFLFLIRFLLGETDAQSSKELSIALSRRCRNRRADIFFSRPRVRGHTVGRRVFSPPVLRLRVRARLRFAFSPRNANEANAIRFVPLHYCAWPCTPLRGHHARALLSGRHSVHASGPLLRTASAFCALISESTDHSRNAPHALLHPSLVLALFQYGSCMANRNIRS